MKIFWGWESPHAQIVQWYVERIACRTIKASCMGSGLEKGAQSKFGIDERMEELDSGMQIDPW